MAETLRNDPIALRHCILYEVLGEVPIWDAYKNLCKRVGIIDYSEFEFWYLRFADKQYELNIDRTQNPQPRELLSQPVEILEMILDNLKSSERLIARKVCQKLRNCLDGMDPKMNKIDFILTKSSSSLIYTNGEQYKEKKSIDGRKCFITKYDDEYSVKYVGRRNCVVKNGALEKKTDGNHFKLALHDLSILLKNPKFNCESLELQCNSRKSTKINQALAGIDHNVKVKNFILRMKGPLKNIPVLPYLDPETIREISIDTYDFYLDRKPSPHEIRRSVLKMAETDAFRAAEKVKMYLIRLDKFPIECLAHNKIVELCAREISHNKEVYRILTGLMESTVLDYACITCHNVNGRVEDGLKNKRSHGWTLHKVNINSYGIPIANSNQFWRMEFVGWRITLKRMSE